MIPQPPEVDASRWRPAPVLHFTPARGWLNDPNGLIEHRGVHHLFFQHNPYASVMEGIGWGHATSTDLLTWTEQPEALRPGAAGPDYDADGCWSGCAVRTPAGIAVVYSGNRGGAQLPCLATADDDDLLRWTKATDNPVIPSWPEIAGITDFRDHAVQPLDGGWRQVVAVGTTTGGLLHSYISPDLHAWTAAGVFLDGPEHDLPGLVWECPDVFSADGCDTVLVSYYGTRGDDSRPGSDVLWATGALEHGRFVPTRYGRLDVGNRFYAPQSYETAAGRRLLFGWLRTQSDPAGVGPSVGAMSLPREVRVAGGRVRQAAAAEIAARRHDRLDTHLEPGQRAGSLAWPGAGALDVVLRAGSTADLLGVSIALVDGSAPARHLVELACFAPDASWLRAPGQGTGWTPEPSAPREARVVADGGLVEVFLDDGRAAAFSDLRCTRVDRVELTRSVAEEGLDVTGWVLR